jgi:hypothetical protein
MIYAIYRLSDGVVVTHTSCPVRQLARNTPAGCGARAGEIDPLSQRIDQQTLEVVDYQPPQPDADHEWDATTKRWRIRPAVEQRNARRESARRQIEAAEVAQARSVREALLAILPDGPEKTRLQQIEDQIAARRGDL